MERVLSTWLDLTKARFKPISDRHAKHYAAIGRFILSVGTDIDAVLHSCLQIQINSGEEAVARIIVGEMRTGDVRANLRRIALSRKLDECFLKSMDALFSEISALHRVRDIVTHRACVVAGSKLAFHNAFLAKTDAAIEVDIYTLAELAEFACYAKRLGYRVVRLLTRLMPVYQPPSTQAYLASIAYVMLQHAIISQIKTGKLSAAKIAQIRSLNTATYAAMEAYRDAAQGIDPTFTKLQQAATEKLAELLVSTALSEAPDGSSLHEIPARLRRQDRIGAKRNRHDDSRDIGRQRDLRERPSDGASISGRRRSKSRPSR